MREGHTRGLTVADSFVLDDDVSGIEPDRSSSHFHIVRPPSSAEISLDAATTAYVEQVPSAHRATEGPAKSVEGPKVCDVTGCISDTCTGSATRQAGPRKYAHQVYGCHPPALSRSRTRRAGRVCTLRRHGGEPVVAFPWRAFAAKRRWRARRGLQSTRPSRSEQPAQNPDRDRRPAIPVRCDWRPSHSTLTIVSVDMAQNKAAVELR